MAIVFKASSVSPAIFADASHAIHADGKGHGCILLKMGTGLVYAKSFKLKMITLSSTESEWMVLCEAATLAEWYKGIMQQFGFNLAPITVYQDNTSTMWLVKNGGNWARTKHLLVKKNKAKESMLNGTIDIKHCASTIMRADMGTKPLSYRMLMVHLDGIGLMEVTRPDGVYTLRQLQVPKERPMDRVNRLYPLTDKVKAAREQAARIENNQGSKVMARKVNTRK